ncbi:HAMP domain-containing histidine kinase [Staphylococcus sp. SQ8-PEA]|uniref:Heme sensor protein HssS n=1 Tax=Staphylococcus marylandisciuri TaxID=2981529 RepID=A0ABT2QMQ4_9STAP|nr:HAMP domain-containing sensor histidine kinase [Staphylococcus marylandisciuri]MCU5745259.1 HAMP domain-containing histidine kinase [Staphylococcus marylandisciuri]
MFKSLYTRIAIYTITVMLFSALVSFLFTNIYYHVNLKSSNDAKIMRTLKEARSYHSTLNNDKFNFYFKHLGEMNYQIMTVDYDGNKRFYGEKFRKDNISHKDVQRVLNGHDYHGIKHLPYHLFVTGFFENVTSNTVGVQFKSKNQTMAVFMRPDIGKTFSEFRTFLAILITLLLLISILLVISSTYAIIKPVQQLKSATEQLMIGNFNRPIKRTRKDELGTLQYRFEKMRIALKQLDDMRSHFVQNVSHEIKTPLTHIHHQLTELRNASSPEDRNIYINEIYRTTTQLSNLTKELLLLAELDNGDHLKLNDSVRVNELITNIVRHNQFAADQKNIVVFTELDEVSLKGNHQLIHQALQNLVTNAIKYSREEGMVEIVVKHCDDEVTITVSDDGEGITEEVQTHLFERFYKVNHHDNSNGLGLAIAQSIVELHEGRITVESQRDEGTTFKVVLPIKR